MTDDLRADGSEGVAGKSSIRLFLCGDVMTGRGIDQVLPHPCNPHLFEPWARSALRYVELAERASGPIGRALDFEYPWGDTLEVLQVRPPDARIVNLETAVTTGEDWQTGKGIHYRMSPDNLPCLTRAVIGCCVLANNHVLDWGPAGLEQTLSSLHAAGTRTVGAGHNAQEAAAATTSTMSIQVAGGLFDRQRSWIDSPSGFEVFAEYVPRPRHLPASAPPAEALCPRPSRGSESPD